MPNLAEIIKEETRKTGAIPFARFMELALYCPVYGFYEKEADTVGRRGDFFTSASVGGLFGELLASQFAAWLKSEHGSGDPVQIVEAGAHRGALARDILAWLSQHEPALLQRLTYAIVEPSPRRRAWQERALIDFADKARWLEAVAGLGRVRGIIFSNELLDAMPVRRLGWDAEKHTWFEWGVTVIDQRFVWTRLSRQAAHTPTGSPSGLLTPELESLCGMKLPIELLETLPDGFTIDVCPAAAEWWRQAAGVLEQGRLLTIDYGLTVDEYFLPERTGGTLRAYHKHRASRDVLANPGDQDLTAHVQFSVIRQAGEAAGLTTEAFLTQAQFLTNIAGKVWQGVRRFGPWTTDLTRQFQTLTHPEHLGRAFRVLIQSRHNQRDLPFANSNPASGE